MAKSKSPLYGIEASGALGDTMVYAKWRGVQYVRRHVVPANPRTAEQMLTRDAFRFLNQLWAQAPALFREPWAAYSRGKPLTDRNAFIKFNIPVLRERTDLAGLIGSPGVGGGFPLVNLVATGGTGSITASATVPALPSGWATDYVVFVAVRDQDPHEDLIAPPVVQSATTSPYSVTFSGLASGTYRVLAWARYTKPDGDKAFSVSLIASATVS